MNEWMRTAIKKKKERTGIEEEKRMNEWMKERELQ